MRKVNDKGDGNPYYERALKKLEEMTPVERKKHEEWCNETLKKFRIIGESKENGE